MTEKKLVSKHKKPNSVSLHFRGDFVYGGTEMKNNIEIRMATTSDANQLVELYRPYVEHTTITFEYETPTQQEFESRIIAIKEMFPYLVCVKNDKIIAYAYASYAKSRAAYGWNAELSIYIDKQCHGIGVGKSLYTALIAMLKLQGFVNLYAVITHPNENSEAFHRFFGFNECGMFRKTGFKFGRWIDVVEMEKRIGEYSSEPPKPIPFMELDRNTVCSILSKSEEFIHCV